MATATEHSEAADQVVLIGASNLTRGLPTVIEAARSVLGGPCRFLVAGGHGRSYGGPSRVLCRSLPGIVECGIWESLDRSGARRTFALLTDIGNDILYGYPAERIAGWVRQCVERLEDAGARIVVTDLPMENVRDVGHMRFLLLRGLFFPSCRMSFEEVVERGGAVSEALHELAAAGRVQLVRQERAWYGVDALHILRRCRAAALGRMMGPWAEGAGGGAAEVVTARVPTVLPGRGLRIRLTAPAWRRVCGIERRSVQPAARLADGSTIWRY